MQEYEILQAEMKRYVDGQDEMVRLRDKLEKAVDEFCPKEVNGGYALAVGEAGEKLEAVNNEVIAESAKQADICMDARKKIYALLSESEPEEVYGNYTFKWTPDGLRVSWKRP